LQKFTEVILSPSYNLLSYSLNRVLGFGCLFTLVSFTLNHIFSSMLQFTPPFYSYHL